MSEQIVFRCRKCDAELTHPDYDFMRHLDQVLQNHDKLTSETARDKHRASIVKFVAEKLAQASEPVATPGPAMVRSAEVDATCVVCKGERDPLNPCGSCEGSGIDPVHFVSDTEIDAFLVDAEIERLAQASWEAADGYVSGVPWSAVRDSFRGEKERRRINAVIAAMNAKGNAS